MSKTSLLQTQKECYATGRIDALEKHHIFGGANRKFSEKYGLWVYLTHDYHNEPPYGAHFDKQFGERLKRVAQKAFEKNHSREEFMQIFGRNWL